MNSIFDYDHPFVCTDAVLLSISTTVPDSYRKLPETNLRILLYKRDSDPHKDKWCLPGGFLSIDELPENSIRRNLLLKADVDECWLEQLYTFCDLNRDSRARVISIAYLGLMNEAASKNYQGNATWFDVDAISEADIGFDHYNIIKTALVRLQSKITYTNIVFNLLPEEFTLTQLQNVYAAILGKKEQASNFRKRIISMVQETDKHTSNKGHRPARLYVKKAGLY
ncbi:MAG: hypothetical protein FWG42_09795 [Clostridiales bacterium]|nr:hypothetical protein [Clostridiales bacterium]